MQKVQTSLKIVSHSLTSQHMIDIVKNSIFKMSKLIMFIKLPHTNNLNWLMLFNYASFKRNIKLPIT